MYLGRFPGSPRSLRRALRRNRNPASGSLTGLVNRFRRLIAHLSSSARRIEARTGITNAQLFLLRTIQERGETAIGELAVLAGVQQSTVSIVAARLEEARLLRRRRSPRDARKVLLRLAPGGRELLRLAPPAPTELLLSALADLMPAERRGLENGLVGLERLLGIDAAPAPMLFEPDRTRRSTRSPPSRSHRHRRGGVRSPARRGAPRGKVTLPRTDAER